MRRHRAGHHPAARLNQPETLALGHKVADQLIGTRDQLRADDERGLDPAQRRAFSPLPHATLGCRTRD